MTSPSSSYDVAVVGGGVIGLSVAWRLGKGGLSVALIDPDPGRGVSSIAAGMLGPTTTRSPYAEKELQRFNATSAAAYPAFITELEKSSGMRVGYECSGAVLIAVETAMAEKNSALSPPVGVERHSDGAGFVESVYKYQSSLGLPVEMMSGEQCRELEPCISPSTVKAVLYEDEGRVDSGQLCKALVQACNVEKVDMLRQRVVHLVADGRGIRGVYLDNGVQLNAGTTVLAAGAWSHLLKGLPAGIVQPIRPLKGQVIRVRARMDAIQRIPTRTVRAYVDGRHVYVVPQPGGQAVIGATLEDQGYDTSVTVEAVQRLLYDASLAVPSIEDAEIVALNAGLRPAAADNVPMIGPSLLEGLFLATGHGRNGVLLAPATAEVVHDFLVRGVVAESVTAFFPQRFTLRHGRTS